MFLLNFHLTHKNLECVTQRLTDVIISVPSAARGYGNTNYRVNLHLKEFDHAPTSPQHEPRKQKPLQLPLQRRVEQLDQPWTSRKYEQENTGCHLEHPGAF